MDKKSIIRRLAEQLPDKELQRIFPDIPAQTVRDLLRGKKKKNPPRIDATEDRVKPGKITSCALFTDGASRGNPGHAGAGTVLFDDRGRELVTRAEYLGRCTNNVAEYKALILGLKSALEMGCPKIDICMDSELIVRQITGRYKVKNTALKSLFAEAQGLLRKFSQFTITPVPRAENARADELANRGIDERVRNG